MCVAVQQLIDKCAQFKLYKNYKGVEILNTWYFDINRANTRNVWNEKRSRTTYIVKKKISIEDSVLFFLIFFPRQRDIIYCTLLQSSHRYKIMSHMQRIALYTIIILYRYAVYIFSLRIALYTYFVMNLYSHTGIIDVYIYIYIYTIYI
jgi:hypothetical protein